jgi:hypothetical protein
LTYGSEQSSKAEGKKPFEFLYSPDIEEDEEDEE